MHEMPDIFKIGDYWYLLTTEENEDDLRNWQWGGTLVVHEVYQRPDGTLGVKIPEGIGNAFQEKTRLTSSALTLRAQDSCEDTRLSNQTGDLFK